MARSLWLLTAVAVAVSLIPVLRQSFVWVYNFCAEPNCIAGQLSAPAARALESAGLAPTTFAAYDDALLIGMVGVFVTVAGIIAWRRPSDPMALLTAFALTLFGGATFINSQQVLGTASPWFTPVNILAMSGSAAIGLFAYLFPSGWRLGRGIVGRFLLPLLAIAWVEVQIASYLAPGSLIDFNDRHTRGAVEWFFFLFSMVAIQIYRYRTVSNSIQRQQTKWVVLGVTVSILSFLALITVAASVPLVRTNAAAFIALATCFRLVMLPLPISIAFAVLRNRLWDVDVLINRTIVYGSLTITLVGAYILGVIGVQALLRTITGQTSELAVAAVTLAIAAIFNPWRRRVQTFIDRRFYRRRYDAARTLNLVSARLRDEVDLETMTAHLMTAIEETVQPSHIAVCLESPRRETA